MTEVVSSTLDKRLFRNSFVLNGRGWYKEFCFKDINALCVHLLPALGLIFYVWKGHHPFFQDSLACLLGQLMKHLCLSFQMTVCIGQENIKQFSILLDCHNCIWANWYPILNQDSFFTPILSFCFLGVTTWGSSFLMSSALNHPSFFNHSLVPGQLRCICCCF